MHTHTHTQIQLWWLLYYFPSIACVDSVGPHKHVNQNHSRVTRNERIRCRVDLKTPVCLFLSSLPAGICSRMWCACMLCERQTPPLYHFNRKPHRKVQQSIVMETRCEIMWLVGSMLHPSANQRVSSQEEDASHNHYLKTDFSPKTSWFNTEPGHHFFWTTEYLSQLHLFLLLDNSAKINAKSAKKKTLQECFLPNIKSSYFRTHH